MAGAIAGTTILRLSHGAERLRVLALTVNNACNLSCPHCYLQYDGPEGLLPEDLANVVATDSFDHLAIVGKEPLLDRRSAELCAELARDAATTGKTTSLISNGIGLRFLSDQTLRSLSYIDVSFDGGPATYASYRRGSYEKLASSVKAALDRGLREINALHVINAKTIDHVDDMMGVTDIAPFAHIMFSPYLVTRNAGRNEASPVGLLRMLERFAATRRFRGHPEAILLIDGLHLAQGAVSAEEVMSCAYHLGIASQLVMITGDPLDYGIMRLTYDGWALEPHDSIHPSEYHSRGARILPGHARHPLARAFDLMIERRRAA